MLRLGVDEGGRVKPVSDELVLQTGSGFAPDEAPATKSNALVSEAFVGMRNCSARGRGPLCRVVSALASVESLPAPRAKSR